MQWPATEVEAAAYLATQLRRSISPRTLQRYRYAGKVGCLKVGGIVRYQQADLDAFIESMRRPAKAS